MPIYENLEPTHLNDFPKLLRWSLTRRRGPWPQWVDSTPGAPPPARVEGPGLRATFVNHATVLLQADGMNVLCDPHWGQRCSPVSFAGPKRVRQPGLKLEDLPKLDAILVSHNHYDHLDRWTLDRLAETQKDARLVTGLGVARSLPKAWAKRAVELDWWQSHGLNGLPLTYVPGRHFSARSLTDRWKSRWGGFNIHFQSGGVYFAGDTGYGRHFEMIQQRLGAPRLAVLPIGAYEPRWFMQHHHMNPADAMLAMKDLGAPFALGMHFGTFRLTDEAYEHPLLHLDEARQAAGVNPKHFRAVDFGEGWDVPEGPSKI
jgi:L-ascorbate metabolism protein UlaG (beta-lactamase superfamily)